MGPRRPFVFAIRGLANGATHHCAEWTRIMNVLIAEDDPVTRCRLEERLTEWGYQVQAVGDGLTACRILQAADASALALLDWMLPGIDGLEVCRRVRASRSTEPPYLIILTGRAEKRDVVAGLQSGANDYLTKPFDDDELKARLAVGQRVVELQHHLAEQVSKLQASLAKVKHLHGLLPICCYCKKIRNDQNYWQQVEAYIAAHSEAEFTHTICPVCFEEKVRPELETWNNHPKRSLDPRQ
jgi:CheY-like chemotaxis protein